MAARRSGTTAVRRWRPRRLNLELGRASTNYVEPIARSIVACGGRVWSYHGDVGWRRSSGELYTAWELTGCYQWHGGNAVGC